MVSIQLEWAHVPSVDPGKSNARATDRHARRVRKTINNVITRFIFRENEKIESLRQSDNQRVWQWEMERARTQYHYQRL